MNVFWNIKNNIQDYLYTMKDYSFEKLYSMMKKEIESMGVIDGGDTVKWKTPDKMFEFEIERVENSFVTDHCSPLYTNIIKIKNNLGILITELRFSEYDCINILSAIADFCQCHFGGDTAAIVYPDGGVYQNIVDQIHIHINPTTTIVNDKMIHLQFSKTNIKLCKFSIIDYIMEKQSMIELLHFVLDYDTLVEMCFVIFFQCIIDLDLDSICMNGYGDDIYKVEDFVYGGFTYEDYMKFNNTTPITQFPTLSVPVEEKQEISSNSEEEYCIPLKTEPLTTHSKTKININ